MMPCHIASFPLAVNIQCHVQRHKEAIIKGDRGWGDVENV
jgi:tartrate dehydratase alpha subunit/fumarate hydratase class I-like protein